MSFAISGVNLELNHETCDRHEAGILRRSMHRKRGAPNSPRIVADAKETACTRVISSPYRITESAEILSRLNPLPNPALLGFQSVEIQASEAQGRNREGPSEGSVEQSRDPTNRNRIRGSTGRTSGQAFAKSISINGQNCKSGGCAMKAVGLTPRDLHRVLRD